MNIRGGKQSGAALIITILLVTVLATIAFSASRLTISELVQTTQLEESEGAYFAAEACVETGLLLYRYNRNAEVPTVADGMSEDRKEYIYFNVTDGKQIAKTEFDNRQAGKSYCALRMWHRHNAGEQEKVTTATCNEQKFQADLCMVVPAEKINEICGTDYKKCYQDPDNPNNYYILPALKQGEVIDYDVATGLEENSSSRVDSINLTWEYLEEPQSFEEQNNFQLLYLPIDENGEVIMEGDQKKELFTYDWHSYGVSKDLTGVQKIRLKPFGGSLQSYTITTDNPSAKLDSRYTHIESTGYYGGTKRKLKSILDRRTKSLLSIYDFLIYSSKEE